MVADLNTVQEASLVACLNLSLYTRYAPEEEYLQVVPALSRCIELIRPKRKARTNYADALAVAEIACDIEDKVARMQRGGCADCHTHSLVLESMEQDCERMTYLLAPQTKKVEAEDPMSLLAHTLSDLAGGISFYLTRFVRFPRSNVNKHELDPLQILETRRFLLEARNPIGCASGVWRLCEFAKGIFRHAQRTADEKMKRRQAHECKVLCAQLEKRCTLTQEFCS